MGTPIPSNEARFTLGEVIEATGAQPRGGAVGELSVAGVTSDSRGAVKGKLFVALRGENFDGHRFAQAAVRAGASAVLAEDASVQVTGAPLLRVASTLDALGALAQLHRRRWGGMVVAVGGSAGKTTTRSAISALLRELLPGLVHSSVGNLNNRIGVPMVLLGLQPQHRVAVIEIGTNQSGEVQKLAEISEPDVAILTLVALEHAQGLGDIDAIEREEGALLGQARRAAIANGDDERALRQLRSSPAPTKLAYGFARGCDYRIEAMSIRAIDETAVVFSRGGERRQEFRTSLLGKPGALAALAAICASELVVQRPVSAELLERALVGGGVGESGRLRPVTLSDGTLLLDDSYNANPASMQAAIEVAAEIARTRSARLLLVLGEMLELGPTSRDEHAALAPAVQASAASRLLAIGGDAQALAEAARGLGVASQFASDTSAALPLCRALVQPGDVVLFKASRGLGLERLVAALSDDRGVLA